MAIIIIYDLYKELKRVNSYEKAVEGLSKFLETENLNIVEAGLLKKWVILAQEFPKSELCYEYHLRLVEKLIRLKEFHKAFNIVGDIYADLTSNFIQIKNNTISTSKVKK